MLVCVLVAFRWCHRIVVVGDDDDDMNDVYCKCCCLD